MHELIGSFLVGAGAAVLPDILEPATSPNHRSVFHSVAISSIPINYIRDSQFKLDVKDEYRWLKNAIAIGYLSHLGLDATTSKRLPLLF